MYKLRARFSQIAEEPTYPLMAFALKMGKTRDKREIYFDKNLSKEELKKAVQEHYQKYGGKIEFFGKIRYYEYYMNEKLLYRLDILGNIVENEKFLDLLIDFYFKPPNEKSKELLKKELKYIEIYEEDYIELFNTIKEAVNRIDPFNITWVDENEYEPEIRDLTLRLIGKNLHKVKIFKKTKAVFEEWFYENEENIEKYWAIAQKIFDFYIEKKRKELWKKQSSLSWSK